MYIIMCFMIVPDKNIMFFLLKIYTRMKFHIRPDITIGEPAKHDQNRKNVSHSFTAISGCVCLYLHKYKLYNIFS